MGWIEATVNYKCPKCGASISGLVRSTTYVNVPDYNSRFILFECDCGHNLLISDNNKTVLNADEHDIIYDDKQ